ncbi:Gag-Pol polyprotein [Trachymyrmex cornetzi]|uniref:Gag-Pol polyprotein n=1 Tax=Trachymyrmex cornetzi TaxID=471704 RepID=A0A151JBD7_9HYME|nr:Gag-Pol polyprotein [Trachymyrmex cornetzi]
MHVGVAVFAPQLQWELMLKLPPYASVFSAEAYAIYTAITLAIDRKLPKATIITDSKSVLEAVKSFRNQTNNYLIPLIRSVLEEAESKGTEINFIWIPSHRGISGNEKADQLAKRAIRQGIVTIERNFKVPYSDLCAVIKQEISDNFYLYLESQADIKGSFYFNNIFKRSAKPWYFRMNIPRESIVMINRLRSDHYNLNYSLHRKNLIDDPSCPCGSPQQDMIHMIYECPESRGSARLVRCAINQISSARDNLTKFAQAISKPSEYLCRLITNFSKLCGRQF